MVNVMLLNGYGYQCPRCDSRYKFRESMLGTQLVAQCKQCGFIIRENPIPPKGNVTKQLIPEDTGSFLQAAISKLITALETAGPVESQESEAIKGYCDRLREPLAEIQDILEPADLTRPLVDDWHHYSSSSSYARNLLQFCRDPSGADIESLIRDFLVKGNRLENLRAAIEHWRDWVLPESHVADSNVDREPHAQIVEQFAEPTVTEAGHGSAQSEQEPATPVEGSQSQSGQVGAPILHLGSRRYRIGNQEIAAQDNEHNLLQAFLKNPAMDEKSLIRTSGVPHAPKLLKRFSEKYSIKEPTIRLPKAKGRGGYYLDVKSACPESGT
jgi:hypothetical protein